MKLFGKRFKNEEMRYNDVNEMIEETKDKFYFMFHGINGFNR